MASQYIHGSHPEEQERLSLLNDLLNPSSLRALRLMPGEQVLDVGSGLGQLGRSMARRVRPTGRVVGIERDEAQISRARRLAEADGETGLVDFRQGVIEQMPLEDSEWGSFDVVHCRFVLEHLRDPRGAVETMVRAARPGGRIVLEDDDHDLLRFHPDAPAVSKLWQAYYETYSALGNDPLVGRRLTGLLQRAGAEPSRTDMLFFGSNAGDPLFEAMVANFAGVMEGAREAIVRSSEWTPGEIDAALEELRVWSREPDAALWYVTCWAEGIKPGDGRAEKPTTVAMGSAGEREALLGFLADSARDLGSTLELDEIFAKIAERVARLLDAHLFCIMLWNEESGLLEHSYSLKYGKHVPQTGGFPLGTGLSGSAARDRRAIRVANVEHDPRYVRFRHAEVEIRSELAVPLLCDGRLVGVLDLESTELAAFSHEHEQILTALASHIAAALENARLFQAVKAEERRLERESMLAREVQKGLLPRRLPSTRALEIGAAHRSALELSGDFYDVQRLGPDRWLFAVGDVAGKGSAAALLASVAVGLLRARMLESYSDPASLLAELNEAVKSLDLDHRFVALVVGEVSSESGRVLLANAGVSAPLLLRGGEGGEISRLDLEGLPLGGLEGSRYRQIELELSRGDALVLLTDGIDDLGHERGQPFGRDDLPDLLKEVGDLSAGDMAERVLRAADQRAALPDSSPQGLDDRTLLVVRIPD